VIELTTLIKENVFMKMSSIITIVVFSCAFMTGCAENVQKSQDTEMMNSELVNSLSDAAIQNAIISQHTLYPYHFMENGAELNELGQHDLAVLTKYFMEHPGRLNIRRDDIPADSYEARVKVVLEHWKKAGIDMKRVNISDGMPGGSGMASEKVVTILSQSPGKSTTSKPAATGTAITTSTPGMY
jgi:hypothetical protein